MNIERMRRANRNRLVRGRWTAEELEEIRREAEQMLKAMAPFID